MILGNALIAGTLSALRAQLTDRDVSTALWQGALGGAVHAAGKALAAGVPSFPFAGATVSVTGAAVVRNAGSPSAFDEVLLPLAFMHLRYQRRTATWRAGVNLYGVVEAAHALTLPGGRLDARRTLISGAWVVHTNRPLRGRGVLAQGATVGSTIKLYESGRGIEATFRHETVHVAQYSFINETVDRPLERWARHRFHWLAALPDWLELGLFTPGLIWLDGRTGEPIGRGLEYEARVIGRDSD